MENGLYKHRMTEKTDIKKFVMGKKAIFSVINTKTQNRATFRVKQSDDGRVFFVSYLNGPNNYNNYRYLGIIGNSGFHKTKKSPEKNTMSYIIFEWLYNTIVRHDTILPDNVEFYHAGQCARCGRLLTDPMSIQIGLGPYCRTRN